MDRAGPRIAISRHLNMFTLIALGTGAAYGYSLMASSLFDAVRLSPWRTAPVLANIAVVAYLVRRRITWALTADEG